MTFSSDRFLITVLDTIGFSLAEWAAELIKKVSYACLHYHALHKVIHDYTGLLR